MRLVISIVAAMVCLGLVACGGSDEATNTPTTQPTTSATPRPSAAGSPTEPPADSYLGAVVGTSRSVDGAPYVTESGTGTYYRIDGIDRNTVLGTVLFVTGRIIPVPVVHVIEASQVITVPEGGSVSCSGTVAKRDDAYFVESSATGGCGSVELTGVDPAKVDPEVGRETELTVRYCTVTNEGRMVKANLDPDFTCTTPYP